MPTHSSKSGGCFRPRRGAAKMPSANPRDIAGGSRFFEAFREQAYEAIDKALKARERWKAGKPHPGFRSMQTFDPSKHAMVHDRLNRRIFEWLPKWRHEYEPPDESGVVYWDGFLLDGWRTLPRRRTQGRRGTRKQAKDNDAGRR